jgi:hypothetical protein
MTEFPNNMKNSKSLIYWYTQNPFEVNLTIVGVKIQHDYKWGYQNTIWQSPFEIEHGWELRFFDVYETFFELTSTICVSSVVLHFSQKNLFVGFILISKIP